MLWQRIQSTAQVSKHVSIICASGCFSRLEYVMLLRLWSLRGDAGCHHWAAVSQCFPTQTACNVARVLEVENKSLLSNTSATEVICSHLQALHLPALYILIYGLTHAHKQSVGMKKSLIENGPTKPVGFSELSFDMYYSLKAITTIITSR